MNICKENQIFMFDLETLVKYIYGTGIPKTTFVSFSSLIGLLSTLSNLSLGNKVLFETAMLQKVSTTKQVHFGVSTKSVRWSFLTILVSHESLLYRFT